MLERRRVSKTVLRGRNRMAGTDPHCRPGGSVWPGGLVGLVCCVGPTVLALLGVVSGATALAWGNELYDGYAWWFRLAGLVTLAVLVVVALRRRTRPRGAICNDEAAAGLRGRPPLRRGSRRESGRQGGSAPPVSAKDRFKDRRRRSASSSTSCPRSARLIAR